MNAAARTWARLRFSRVVRCLLALVLLPLALLIMFPVLILLALAYYARFAVVSLGALLRVPGKQTGQPATAMQAPHYFQEIPTPKKKAP